MSEPQLAILMTCHNRRALTLRCLESLKDQPLFEPENLFLVDDGSSDGTGAAVAALLPAATVIAGDGSLFWNGGMRLAWERAKAAGRLFDFYLWLNDDVVLAPGVLRTLVDDADATVPRGGAVIVAAAVTDPHTGAITYGAHRRPDPRRPLRFMLLAPEGKPIPADTISGNVVLVSAAAECALGNMSPEFEHIYGDLDYGLRAKARSIPVVLSSAVGGTCSGNDRSGSSADEALGKIARLRKLRAEQAKVHGRDWRRFVRLHGGGLLARVKHRLSPYLRILVDRPNRFAGMLANAGPRAS